MRIGYPCLNRSIGCSAAKTFRLKSYSKERLIAAVDNNLACLKRILEFNLKNNFLFFRISSQMVPFASHPICRFDWQSFFKAGFASLGRFIKKHNMRISMHPDQFTLINSPDKDIVQRSISELLYHAQVLESLGLDTSAKIQIHVGGVYKDKQKSIERFIKHYQDLPLQIKRRLVIENDDRSYTLDDCLQIHKKTNIPILFDVLHHQANCSGQKISQAFKLICSSWKKTDGIPMVDYSQQKPKARSGTHAESINISRFKQFLKDSKPFDFDIMLEIKDKEKSAFAAVQAAKKDKRFSSDEG